jgi:hypothetical protein
LLDARPRSLLSVKRERPLTKKERDEQEAAAVAAAAATASGQPAEPAADTAMDDGPDFFAVDPRTSVRAPGFLRTTGFRLVFVGETASLRSLLNRLASFELPVLVREVEVEPASPEETLVNVDETAANSAASVVLTVNAAPNKAAAKSTSIAAPIVAKPFSKFTVTVEHVELVPPPPAEGAAAPPS